MRFVIRLARSSYARSTPLLIPSRQTGSPGWTVTSTFTRWTCTDYRCRNPTANIPVAAFPRRAMGPNSANLGGRPYAILDRDVARVRQRVESGESITRVARSLRVSRAAVRSALDRSRPTTDGNESATLVSAVEESRRERVENGGENGDVFLRNARDIVSRGSGENIVAFPEPKTVNDGALPPVPNEQADPIEPPTPHAPDWLVNLDPNEAKRLLAEARAKGASSAPDPDDESVDLSGRI